MRRTLIYLPPVIIVLVMLGCSFQFPVTHKYFDAMISARYGGTINLPRGITVSFLPGTFITDTPVNIGLQDRTEYGSSLVFFFADPLSIMRPITVTIPAGVLEVKDDEVLIVHPVFSTGGVNYASDEFHVDQDFGIASFTKDKDQVVQIKGGFPYCIIVGKADALYYALHLPGKYLLEGDLLYYIDMNWFPGHAGLYLGVCEDIAFSDSDFGYNDGVTFADSFPYQSYGGSHIVEDGVFVFPNDVDPSLYQYVFRLDTYGHRWLGLWADRFLGPRRYDGKLTPEERRQISRYVYEAFSNNSLWTVGLAWRGYRNIPFSKRAMYSCVGLPERAYESAGRGIVPFWSSLFYLTTSEHFSRTVPVDEITEYLGETISFRVNSLVAREAVGCSPIKKTRCVEIDGWNWYSTNTVELHPDSPGELKHLARHCEYSWEPTEEGQFDVTFRFFANVNENEIERYHTLTIKVESPSD